MYTRENFKEVKSIIDLRRSTAQANADSKNAEVAALSDEIRAIDKELRATGLKLFKAACSGEDITPIKERNQKLCDERRKLILSLGLPEDYTDVKYECPVCSDSGFVNGSMCSCFKELLVKANIKSSGVGALIESQSFDNFDLDIYRSSEENYKRMRSIFIKAKNYVDDFGNGSPKTLLFIGKTGTGKTHISTSIAKALIEKGVEVIYESSQNIINAFEHDKFKSGYGPTESQGDKYIECELLIIDDLGAEFVNQFTISCLYNLINTRQNKGLATIISTNLESNELRTNYEGRIHSRLIGHDTTVWQFVGTDYRMIGNLKK